MDQTKDEQQPLVDCNGMTLGHAHAGIISRISHVLTNVQCNSCFMLNGSVHLTVKPGLKD